jgi:hypothetical protein
MFAAQGPQTRLQDMNLNILNQVSQLYENAQADRGRMRLANSRHDGVRGKDNTGFAFSRAS